jgi:hypothetical protein
MSVAPRVPAIHGDLGPAARLAFGRWAASVYGIVAHLDTCPFGCTAGRPVCSDGTAAVDAELAAWQSWLETR